MGTTSDVMVKQLMETPARGRKLPDDDVLTRLHQEDGKSIKEIAVLYGATYEAVRLRMKAIGVEATAPQPRYGLPWRVRADHAQSAVVREWKKWKRREIGQSRSKVEAEHVDKWVAYMEGNNVAGVPLSIAYDRTEGFYLRPRRVGDTNYLSID